MPKNRGEWFNSLSHLSAAIGIIVGSVFLISLAKGLIDYVVISIVYGVSLLFLFSASFLFHFTKEDELGISFLRQLDHIAIYVMIAGSYTAIVYIYFETYIKWIIIGAQWAIVAIAIPIKILKINIGRWLDISIYIAMGWMLLPTIKLVLQYMDVTAIILLFLGGIIYTVGAILYAMENNNSPGKVFGLHQIFHVLIIIAAVLHYLVVYFGLHLV
ncbi:MAG: hemolysin III family protein [Candidatus Heimdallarchaeota archaeon]|nr:hemolysin III family protein [Candidatus Heimdallarchaeota archaeon]MCK4876017.1 hemolysin III family protein [Candidatus Heimdallarchaeota archaeon]